MLALLLFIKENHYFDLTDIDLHPTYLQKYLQNNEKHVLNIVTLIYKNIYKVMKKTCI